MRAQCERESERSRRFAMYDWYQRKDNSDASILSSRNGCLIDNEEMKSRIKFSQRIRLENLGKLALEIISYWIFFKSYQNCVMEVGTRVL